MPNLDGNQWHLVVNNFVAEVGPPLYEEQVPQHIFNEDEMANIKAKKILEGMANEGRSASLLSDEYRALTEQLEGSLKTLHREKGELEGALEEISKQAEVVRDIGIQVQEHIAILQKVAIRLEVMKQTLNLPNSKTPVLEPVGGRSPPAEAAPPAQAGLKPIAPGLWQQGQG